MNIVGKVITTVVVAGMGVNWYNKYRMVKEANKIKNREDGPTDMSNMYERDSITLAHMRKPEHYGAQVGASAVVAAGFAVCGAPIVAGIIAADFVGSYVADEYVRRVTSEPQMDELMAHL